ncbi:MAG: helix-turn-helix transcriptional regulator [Treponema sp.]|nr:helix-turn-helix transcriptional regulator [Treponema sp.]
MLLANFLPAGSRALLSNIAFFSFSGVVLGALLCPLFLSNPACKKPLPFGIVFIVLLLLPNLILRFLGVELYLASLPVRGAIHVLSGILSPLTYGLFFLTHLSPEKSDIAPRQENRLSRYCIFFFCLAIAGGFLMRFISLPLLQISGLSSDPQNAMSFIYNGITWLICGIGLSAIVCVIMLNRAFEASAENTTDSAAVQPKTNWSLLFCLIGISAIFRILNAIVGLRLTPILNQIEGMFNPELLVIALAISAIGFFAGRGSINRFIKWFLPSVIAIFILLPCLYFFDNYPGFILFMDILLELFANLSRAIFPAVLVTAYVFSRPGPEPNPSSALRGFWFYFIVTAEYLTHSFQFIIFRLNSYIPPISTEFVLLLTCISAILLFFLSFRILFDKEPIEPQSALGNAAPVSFEEIFVKYRLSAREAEIARIMVEEGLGSESIAKRVNIASITVKNHITSIYRKCDVKNRAEFMSLFVNKL